MWSSYGFAFQGRAEAGHHCRSANCPCSAWWDRGPVWPLGEKGIRETWRRLCCIQIQKSLLMMTSWIFTSLIVPKKSDSNVGKASTPRAIRVVDGLPDWAGHAWWRSGNPQYDAWCQHHQKQGAGNFHMSTIALFFVEGQTEVPLQISKRLSIRVAWMKLVCCHRHCFFQTYCTSSDFWIPPQPTARAGRPAECRRIKGRRFGVSGV